MSNKVKAARMSIISNSSLIVLKLIVGLITGSVSIISEAIHSASDLVAALIAYFSVKVSDTPADEKHPYGHGKIENISGVIEALLILAAAAWIIFESIRKFSRIEKIESVGLGFLVMFISAGVNLYVSGRLYKVAKLEDSVALEADALHLKADIYTSVGVGIGLLLIWITGILYLDPIVAIAVAIFIIKEAVELLITAFNPLLDVRLSDEDIAIIHNVLSKYKVYYCETHKLRTRKSGKTKYIDLHLVFSGETPIGTAHDISTNIEQDIEASLKNTQILIHLEACDKKQA